MTYIETIIRRATALGCTCRTHRGVARWLIRHRWRWAVSRPQVMPGDVEWRPTYRRGTTGHTTRAKWRQHRTFGVNRDARRARRDPVFRRQWIAGVRRRAQALVDVPLGTLTEISNAVATRASRQSSIDDLRAILLEAGANRVRLPDVAKVGVGVRLSVSAEEARRAGAELNLRGYAARIIPTRAWSHGDHIPGETTWKNGNPVAYTRARHDNYVRSFAVPRGRELHIALHTMERTLTVPEGWTWDVDELGIRLVRGGHDQHPECLHSLTQSGVDAIIAGWEAMVERKEREIAIEHVRLDAIVRDTMVTLDDSRAAGNCVEGSLAFAERRLGIPRADVLAARWLVGVPAGRLVATGDARAIRAVRCAWMRETQVSI